MNDAAQHRTTFGIAGGYGVDGSTGYVEMNSAPDDHGGSYISVIAHKDQVNPQFHLKNPAEQAFLVVYGSDPLEDGAANRFVFGNRSVNGSDPRIFMWAADSDSPWAYADLFVGTAAPIDKGMNIYTDKDGTFIKIGHQTTDVLPGVQGEGVYIRSDDYTGTSVEIHASDAQAEPLLFLRSADDSPAFRIMPDGAFYNKYVSQYGGYVEVHGLPTDDWAEINIVGKGSHDTPPAANIDLGVSASGGVNAGFYAAHGGCVLSIQTIGKDSGADKLGFFSVAPTTRPTVSGSKGGNAALGSLISALATLGLVIDSTT